MLILQNCTLTTAWLGPVVVVVPWRLLALQRCFWLMQSILAIRWLWQLLRDCRQSFHQSCTLLLHFYCRLWTSFLFLQLGAVPLFLEDLKRCKVRGCFWLMRSILAIRWLWQLLRDRGQSFFGQSCKLLLHDCTITLWVCTTQDIHKLHRITNLLWYWNFTLSTTEMCYIPPCSKLRDIFLSYALSACFIWSYRWSITVNIFISSPFHLCNSQQQKCLCLGT